MPVRPSFNAYAAVRTLAVAVVLSYLPALPARGQGYPAREAAKKMSLGEGLAVKLFAGEPEIRQPILVKCDDRGRLWVIQYLQYPNPAGLKRVRVDRYSRTVYDRVPEPPPRGPKGADRITICQDLDGDGHADRFHDFVSDLNLCTGLEFGDGGVYVLQAPYLLFYRDQDNDDVPDGDPDVLLEGFGMEDAQSLVNHLTFGPDGWLYGLNGSTTTCRIRGIEFQQGVWRYHPRSKQFELFCEGGGNGFGLTFDAKGRLIYSSNGGLCWHGVQGGYYEKTFGKHGPLHNPYAYGWFSHVEHTGLTGRPNTGGTIYLADVFPPQYRGAFLCGDFLGHTCSWWKVAPRGSTIKMSLGGLLLDSHDTWFGATDLCLAPDGAVFVCDFFDRRTAHPDPDAHWDTSNGRVYKIVPVTSQVPQERVDLPSLSSDRLVDLLQHSNHWWRGRARRRLSERRDSSTFARLRTAALQEADGDLALESLWALYGSGGWSEELAVDLLDHSDEHVRCWTVRLLGEARQVTPRAAEKLATLAATEPSVVVRAQLASTAKRLSGSDALPIVAALMLRDEDADDPHLPWLLWWAMEDKAIEQMPGVLDLFHEPLWRHVLLRENARRLVRRYAAEAKSSAYAACARLLRAAPNEAADGLLAELSRGLDERKPAGREPPAVELKELVARRWQASPERPLYLALALQVQLPGAEERLMSLIAAPHTNEADRIKALGLLGRFGSTESVAAALPWIDPGQPEAVQRAAVATAGRFENEQVARQLVSRYAGFSAVVRGDVRETLLSRPRSALALLEQVDRGVLRPDEIPLEQLQRAALHHDAAIDALVRKIWGNIGPGTPEEKLADIRRFSNDLRAGEGDRAAGKALFTKHCGICHQLFGEGNHVGPELTKANRGDRNALLTNIIDPSSVVRKEYASYVLATTGGQVLTGILAEQDPASVTLVDAKNQRTRIVREEIDELEESRVSLMPERLLEPLTPQELRDLFAYLQQ
ncbi:MAG TPA: PVC-type heme-binding CxxCH protein [Pirellulales bacterium]|nr:PVC-type heme-binding CxxCH protein [Pirellulales bacterium]